MRLSISEVFYVFILLLTTVLLSGLWVNRVNANDKPMVEHCLATPECKLKVFGQ